ncbi:hypothetical protein NL676_021605 [Syzygium grande]|nr:hypothetical protein NL676_021605 [Syzygium grande]
MLSCCPLKEISTSSKQRMHTRCSTKFLKEGMLSTTAKCNLPRASSPGPRSNPSNSTTYQRSDARLLGVMSNPLAVAGLVGWFWS